MPTQTPYSAATRSPAIDPADIAAHAERPVSKPGIETQAERDAAARVAGRDKTEAPKLTPEQAKTLLLDAARAFDPLRQVREHPWAVVGAAAGAGLVVGSSGGTLFHLTKLTGGVAKLLVPLAGLATKVAAGHAAGMAAAHGAAAGANNADATSI